jgi:hypothetical protein
MSLLAEAVFALAASVHTASLNDWNDAPGRTQADALAGIDAAIASAAERSGSQVRRFTA